MDSVNKNSSSQKPLYLKFTVKDTGIGIRPDTVKKLFSPFSQADVDTTRKFGGSGLGLTISKRLVNMMNGRIHVESSYGHGAQFEFFVQLTINTTEPIIDTIATRKKLSGLSALVTGGSDLFRQTIKQMLNIFKIHTYTCNLSEEALKGFIKKEITVDFIILDQFMSDLKWNDLIKQIHISLKTKAPVILTTNIGANAEIKEDSVPEIATCITKPIYPTVLINAILNILGEKTYIEEYLLQTDKTNTANELNILNGKHILVAEDNLTNQALTRAMLKRAGITVVIAENGKAAVIALEKEIFDAVLMDIQMPEMDGYEATRLIRNNHDYDSLPIIAMTANALKGDKDKCLAAGMNAYISKPVNRNNLLKILTDTFRKKI